MTSTGYLSEIAALSKVAGLERNRKMEQMQNLLIVTLLCTALVASSAARPSAAHEPEIAVASACGEQNPTITVVGRDKVGLVPDVARARVGADAMGASISGAKTEVETRIASSWPH